MKAFVSYSFRDSELYIVSLLFEQLKKSGYYVESSTLAFDNINDLKIKNSDVFVGIITNDSLSEYVFREWSLAKQNKIKNILIVEDGVKFEETHDTNIIRFNRSNPNTAIEKLIRINKNSSVPKKSDDSLGEFLIAAGIIAGVAALIALLSESQKK